jgi:hypothetical protein
MAGMLPTGTSRWNRLDSPGIILWSPAGAAGPVATQQHNGAASIAYRAYGLGGGNAMRMLLGIIIGGLLTVGGAYVADSVASKDATAKPMVNWEVVGKNVEALSAFARETWKRVTG